MNKSHLSCFAMSLILTLGLSGCLSFGTDEETTAPSATQVARCVAEMHIRPDVGIHPLGFKLLGSGIDDAIWFKFETNAAPFDVFDGTIVDIQSFESSSHLLYVDESIDWWDVKGKTLWGGQVQLPNSRSMNVGIEKQKSGKLTVYIMWHET